MTKDLLKIDLRQLIASITVIKKRVWIRKGDLIIINPWEFETPVDGKSEKCEISWRYLRHEVSYLERNRRIPKILDIDNIPHF